MRLETFSLYSERSLYKLYKAVFFSNMFSSLLFKLLHLVDENILYNLIFYIQTPQLYIIRD